MSYELIKESLWTISKLDLLRVTIYNDFVILCRLWPIWVLILFGIVFMLTLKGFTK
jgi:hypothetical protein